MEIRESIEGGKTKESDDLGEIEVIKRRTQLGEESNKLALQSGGGRIGILEEIDESSPLGKSYVSARVQLKMITQTRTLCR